MLRGQKEFGAITGSICLILSSVQASKINALKTQGIIEVDYQIPHWTHSLAYAYMIHLFPQTEYQLY